MSLEAQISYPACFAGFAGSSHFFAKSVRSTLSTFASTALLREGKGRGRDTLEQPFGMWGSFLSAGGQPRDRPKLQTLNCSVLPWVKWGISFPSGHVVGGLEISKPLGSTFSPYVGELLPSPPPSIQAPSPWGCHWRLAALPFLPLRIWHFPCLPWTLHTSPPSPKKLNQLPPIPKCRFLQLEAKKNLRQHSVLDWSPTSILSGPCDACLRGSDETRNVHRGMAADEIHCARCTYVGHFLCI
jgi:hypothetical protein